MTDEPNPAQRLHALGQSLWLDSINRGAFGADWAALLAAIREKASEPETRSMP